MGVTIHCDFCGKPANRMQEGLFAMWAYVEHPNQQNVHVKVDIVCPDPTGEEEPTPFDTCTDCIRSIFKNIKPSDWYYR